MRRESKVGISDWEQVGEQVVRVDRTGQAYYKGGSNEGRLSSVR